ncbi:differentially expressed in FDCP 6 homolog [Triplophysa dalaica]|uniref:differentially expressed in FDCP 6 homolog n=1 Tax=Triplophysa dalaica TaxID=1582913 RepID=UPI0024DF47A2|nr:differentially expressed in FDCP 6 homolog [Triplophysa dalaica]XP_056615373.1 differentially expressed in FDCP 6 homolog [Triplophysa dalaica]XP_056615374.1 differentially expressed in FDCP 6 homolog [Triplophysa dalaica]XP_056615375.1 differentially expressed in FDCP 6 homolog [Triplophysa dalaica]XP_056615376.1 differentially expressed in FDCP 6 homolog [Triplophysa dalaica]
MMALRAALLKSIWYAFTSLDTEDSGKVSKSQLKVLSHNLHSVLRIPHDHPTLERHFSDDDDGPVSSQGYMPYLNQFILDKVVEGTFVKEQLDELCWTLCSKKHYRPDTLRVLSNQDALRLWCLFNFLAEDRYPLVLVLEEVEYLLRKISSVMTVELNCVDMEEFLSQDTAQKEGLSVWSFLQVVNAAGSRGVDRESISMAVEKVYREMVGNVLKEGYLWKKGHLRRNWTERWFCLKPGSMSYFMNEDGKECKGVIEMDQNCCVEVLSDRDGKRCMFCVKTLNKSFEISASDSRQRQEWITAIQTSLRLSAEGKNSLHEELRGRRQELREERNRRRALRAEETRRLQELQGEREEHLAELEHLKEAQRQAQASLQEEEQRRRSQHEELQKTLQRQLQDAQEARANLRAEVTVRDLEVEHQRRRIKELEDLHHRLQEALDQQIRARQEEETYRYTQTRLLAEEEEKVKSLLALQEEQEEQLLQTQREKQELRQEMEKKTHSLGEAQHQLEKVRASRRRVDQDIADAQRKLRQASTSVKHWNVQMNRLMHPICPGERRSSCSGSLGLGACVPSVGETESRTREIHRQNSFDCEENITHADNMDYNNTNPSDDGDQKN